MVTLRVVTATCSNFELKGFAIAAKLLRPSAVGFLRWSPMNRLRAVRGLAEHGTGEACARQSRGLRAQQMALCQAAGGTTTFFA